MNQPTQNKMGTAKIPALMLSMGIPMILSMMLQAVYNIVDSAFVSNMANGEEALNALTLAFPVQMLMVAVGIGTGVGANALLSRSLGQNDREKVNRVAGNALFLAAVIYVVFLIFGLVGVPAYILSQTGRPSIVSMGVDYLRICCVCSFGIVFFSIYEKLLQATGRSLYSTIAQVAGAVVNIILDPVLIFGYFGCPAMGVQGAAYATVIGQCVSFLLALIFHWKVNTEISNRIVYWKPSLRIIGQIYSIGLPAILAQALMSVMTYGINIILGGISGAGESAVTAYGLYYKIQQFVLFAAFGLRDAMTPILSFNYGMQSKHRIRQGMVCGMVYTAVIMVLGTVVLEVFAVPFAGLFGLSGETQYLCISAMRIISASFLFAGANIAFQGIFQALQSGSASLLVSVCRQILFVLPVAWFFARAASQPGGTVWPVWLTFPIAEAATCIVAAVLLFRLYRKRVAVIPNETTVETVAVAE